MFCTEPPLHGLAELVSLASVNQLMNSANRPYMLNGHEIRIFRSIPREGNMRFGMGVLTLYVRSSPDFTMPEAHELSSHFGQWGEVQVGMDHRKNAHTALITYQDYDCVDQVLLARPHVIQGVELTVSKYIQIPHLTFANWRTSTLLSPTHSVELRQLANVHCTFANTFGGTSPIGKSPLYFRQHIRWNFAIGECLIGEHTATRQQSQRSPSPTTPTLMSTEPQPQSTVESLRFFSSNGENDRPNDLPQHWKFTKRTSGRGGQGEVSLLEHCIIPNTYAVIKIYKDDHRNMRMRAFREVGALETLSGTQHVSELYDERIKSTNIPLTEREAVESRLQFWVILKLIDGCSLKKFLQERSPRGAGLPLLDSLKLTQKLLSVIQDIHLSGIVHRDIKPTGNIMVVCPINGSIDEDKLHIVDFGLAYYKDCVDVTDWSHFYGRSTDEETDIGTHFT
ncbi:unnamed protein product [Rotaria socialis]|uniref:non-specific serine/threonine protein kinase n=1 Tax=Rotaria socialis TaxID=392032 RepID=A0A818G5V2_9BILA|nr:unnamed protein product [Rotaria socialis]